MSRSHSNSNQPVTPSPAAPASATPVATPLPPETVAQCIALLEQVDALIGPVTSLSADAIHRSLKRRKGAAQVVTDLVALCHQHGVTSVGRISVEQMSGSMSRAIALQTIGVQLAATQKRLDDAAFSAWSNAWQNATALYTILQRLALIDPPLAPQAGAGLLSDKEDQGREAGDVRGGDSREGAEGRGGACGRGGGRGGVGRGRRCAGANVTVRERLRSGGKAAGLSARDYGVMRPMTPLSRQAR